jgi:signal peptidase II
VTAYRRLFALLPAALVLLDQGTKSWIRHNLPMDGRHRSARIQVIDGFFAIVHRENPGAAFGLLREFEYRRVLFVLIVLAATAVIVRMARELRPGQTVLAVALCCILAGAYGNGFDRLFFGTVTDFLEFRASGSFAEWTRSVFNTSVFPQFNVADICVNTGVGLFIIHTLFLDRKQPEPAPNH